MKKLSDFISRAKNTNIETFKTFLMINKNFLHTDCRNISHISTKPPLNNFYYIMIGPVKNRIFRKDIHCYDSSTFPQPLSGPRAATLKVFQILHDSHPQRAQNDGTC